MYVSSLAFTATSKVEAPETVYAVVAPGMPLGCGLVRERLTVPAAGELPAPGEVWDPEPPPPREVETAGLMWRRSGSTQLGWVRMMRSAAPAMRTRKARVQTATRKGRGAGSRLRDPGYQMEPSGSRTPYPGPAGTAGISAVTTVDVVGSPPLP